MKIYIVWGIIIIGELLGLYTMACGIKKRMQQKGNFEIKHLFQNISFQESSGTLLIFEGFFLSISGVIFAYFYFFV